MHSDACIPPHLLWACESISDLRQDVRQPENRMEERLLACSVPETPAPPGVLDYESFIEDLAEIFKKHLDAKGSLLVATDGSVIDNVAAFSVVVEGA